MAGDRTTDPLDDPYTDLDFQIPGAESEQEIWLYMAQNTFQWPIHNLTRNITQSKMSACREAAFSALVNIGLPDVGLSTSEEADAYTTFLSASDTVSSSFSLAFNTSAGSEAHCAEYFTNLYPNGCDPTYACYCTRYKFKSVDKITTDPGNPSGGFGQQEYISNRLEDISDVLEPEYARDKITGTSVSKKDYKENSPTPANLVGSTLKTYYGHVVIQNPDILWIDKPYQYPYSKLTVSTKAAVDAPDLISDNDRNNPTSPVNVVDNSANRLRNPTTRIDSLSLSTQYEPRTSILISLGTRIIHDVHEVYINNEAVPKGQYTLYKGNNRPVLFVHNNDLNASNFMPGYRDHKTLLHLKDVPLPSDMSNITLRVQGDAPAVENDIHVYDTTLPNSKPYLNISNGLYYDNNNISLVELRPSLLKNTSTGLSFPSDVISEPTWWRVDRDNVLHYLTISNEIKTFDVLSGLDAQVQLSLPSFPEFIEVTNNGYVYKAGNTINYYNRTAELNDTISKSINYNSSIDLISNTGYLYRVAASHSELAKHNIGFVPDAIGRTVNYYLMFNNTDNIIIVFNASDMTRSGIEIPYGSMSSVSNIQTNFYSTSSDSLFSVVDDLGNLYNIYTQEIRTELIKAGLSNNIKTQVFNNQSIFFWAGLSGVEKAYIIDTRPSSLGDPGLTLRDTLIDFYGDDFDSRYGNSILGVKIQQNFLQNLQSLYPNPSDGTNIQDISSDVLDLEESYKTSIRSPALDISFGTVNIRKPFDTIRYLNSDDIQEVFDIKTISADNITMSDDQAYSLLSQNVYKYYNPELVTFYISNFNSYVGSLVNYQGNTYSIIKEETLYYNKLIGRKVRYPELDITLPSSLQEVVEDETLTPKWNITGSKVYYLPIVLDDTDRFTFGYIGRKPSSFCIDQESCDIAVPVNPMDLVGRNLNTAALFYTKSTQFDETNTFTIQFNKNPTNFLSAQTYDALIEDKFLNLLLVGYEAVQFTDFIIQPDNRTVIFSGLLRGRFNSYSFMNKHTTSESCYVITQDNTTTFSKTDNSNTWFSIYPLYDLEDNTVEAQLFKSEVSEFTEGTVNVIGSGLLSDLTTLYVSLQSTSELTTVKFALRPFVLGQPTANLDHLIAILEGSLTDKIFRLDISSLKVPQNQRLIYYYVEQENRLPDTGIILLNPLTQVNKYSDQVYTIIGPNNTIESDNTSEYVMLEP